MILGAVCREVEEAGAIGLMLAVFGASLELVLQKEKYEEKTK